MDPATVYAITVTFAGIGTIPQLRIEPLPPQWTISDCIRDHEQKLAGRPHTRALCVSLERFRLRHPVKRYLISIRSDTRAVDLTTWQGTMAECQDITQRYSDRVTAFCVEVRRLDAGSKTRLG